jgi:Fibronectin type III domain
VWFALAAVVVVVVGLAAGLVVWAPWVPPPVLRPAGLAAGPATANSISFRWSRPPTGPLPDKYLILSDDRLAGSVAGTATSYRQAGLTPASSYQYSVVAVRGGKRSPRSAALPVSTLTPPISQARLQGSWSVTVRYLQRVFGVRNVALPGEVIPACAAGACDVTLHVTSRRHPFSVKLTRAGAVYRGQTVVGFIRCGTAGNSIPDPTTLKFRVRITSAAGEGQVWAATSMTGTMTGTSRYVSNAAFYCPAHHFKATLSGSPN